MLNRPTQAGNERRASASGPQPAPSLLRQTTASADGDREVDGRHTQASPTRALPIPGKASVAGEWTPLQHSHTKNDGKHVGQYGSIIASPPTSPAWSRKDAPSLRLPGPALDPQAHAGSDVNSGPKAHRTFSNQSTGSAYQVGPPKSSSGSPVAQRHRSTFQADRTNSMPGSGDFNAPRPGTRRTFTFRGSKSPAPSDIVLHAYREVDSCQSDFFAFLDSELQKIEEFYKQKEDEATDRLKVLREQLHIMRDRRVEELLDMSGSRANGQKGDAHAESGNGLVSRDSTHQNGDETKSLIQKRLHFDPLKKRTRGTKTAEAMKKLGTPSGPRPLDAMQDYVRRKKPHEVPYRAAKHKLKIALAEYYRGLELLKSYALLNRTAFRKITKKFDKTVNARPSGRYMNENVNNAYFVKSSMLETHIQAVEDLYARYFERGNHKIAVGKLRAKGAHAGDYTGSVFRNGLLLGIGAVFAVQGIVHAGQLTFDRDATLALHTSYLLQVRESLIPY